MDKILNMDKQNAGKVAEILGKCTEEAYLENEVEHR
jgi:hypothetical protein